jgi:hypothetical protein
LWERSVSIDLGYHMRKKGNLIALGLGWDRPLLTQFIPF